MTDPSPWPGRVLAAASGSLVVLAHPEPSLGPLAFVVLVPWFVLVAAAPDRREAAWRSWAGATGLMLAVHLWLAPATGPFLLLLAGALAVLLVPAGVLVHRLLAPPIRPRRAVAATLLVPAAWVLAEFARSWSALGGPWGLMGTTQWTSPAVLAVAAIGGVWLVSAVLVAANVAVAAALLATSARDRAVLAVMAVAVVAVPVGLGQWARPAPAGGTVHVVGVQVGVVDDEAARLDAAVDVTRSISSTPDLVVWGESGVAYDLDRSGGVRSRLEGLAAAVGAPLLVNTDARTDDGRIRKASRLVTADGLAGEYVKTRLVPFGEYVPMRPVLGWVSAITDAADEDRARGDGARVLDHDGVRLGPLVCFESAFPDMTRALVRRGADLIVVQSATTTFQDTWAPAQHAGLAAVRAAEAGRPVLHATLSGVSAAFDAAGNQLARVPRDRTGSYDVRIPLAAGTTPYVRWGDWVPALAVVVLAAAGPVGLARRRRP